MTSDEYCLSDLMGGGDRPQTERHNNNKGGITRDDISNMIDYGRCYEFVIILQKDTRNWACMLKSMEIRTKYECSG